MKRMRILSAVAAVALLAGCGSTSTSTTAPATSTPATNAAQQTVAAYVAGASQGLTNAVTQANAGLAAAAPVISYACALGSALGNAYTIAAPLAGASGSDNASEQLAMSALDDACASPPATNVAAAAGTILGIVQAVQQSAAKVDPVSAAVSVPTLSAPPATSS